MLLIYYRTALFITVFSLSILNIIKGQESVIEISGVVKSHDTKEPLPNVSVNISGSVTGTITSSTGNFSLRTRLKFPFKLVFSSIGFEEQEFTITGVGSKLNIELSTQTVLGKEVVVTASRVQESILRSPVAIEKLDIRAIKETPAPSFYDALENVKGVQMTTSSLTFKVPNTRGFNIPNNFRFMQLVDGIDMQAATLGVPLGNAIGPTELDISSVEITPGAASALYGMNAINGMANLLTKSPFLYQGLSIYHKTGVNHVDGKDHDPGLLTESAIRYAKAFNNRFAFKLNASYLRGTDWRSGNVTDQNPNSANTANPAFPELNGGNNAAYDAWNKYGDENNNAITINGVNYNGSQETFIVRRTGYWERDLSESNVDNLKIDGSVHYRLGSNAELSYGYRFGKMDGLFQRGNKIRLDNVTVQNHKLELKGSNYFIRSYVLLENTGDSYNLKPMADNLDLNNGTNKEWGTKFKSALQDAINNGSDLAAAMSIARQSADAGRAEPGTAAFNDLLNTIRKINNWDIGSVIPGAPATGGAFLSQKSRTYHFDAQWDLSERLKYFDLLIGVDGRVFEVIPDGNNFVDYSKPISERTTPGGKNVHYQKYGAFGQVTKTLFQDRLKLFASLRLDYNPEFEPKLNPRVAAVYTIAQKHNIRLSFQNGYRFPALFEALSYVNNGNVRRVGGLAFINEGLGYLDNSYTLASVNNFNAAYNKDRDPALEATQVDNDAALKNRDLLVVTDLAPTRPEQIISIEAGYKAVLLNNKLVVDFDAYTNKYDGFLGQVEVSVPSTDRIGTDGSVIDMVQANRSNQTRYRVFTNAKNSYRNYGSSLGITYNFYKKYTIAGNVNFNDIKTSAEKDVFVTGFNTPKWIMNLSFGNRELFKNFGFNIVWKWQDSFVWESPLANGTVPSYNIFDAQVSYKVPKLKSSFKLGASNVFNTRYIQYAAGPTIGGLYYLAVTVEGLMGKK